MSRQGRGGAGRPDGSHGGEAAERDERKERILHTRVPDSLDRHIKRRARHLGMSVSTVVRNVLLNTFGLVEGIVADTTNIALALTEQETPAPGPPARGVAAAEATLRSSEILGWQQMVLNLNAVCDRCNAVLRKGSRAAIGVRERPGPRTMMCSTCLGTVAGTPRGGDERRAGMKAPGVARRRR